jgi:hypothetical protein
VPARSSSPPIALFVALEYQALARELASYQVWRRILPVKERQAELLWSPKGFRFPRAHDATDRAWIQQKLVWQRQYGDGHLKARAAYQREALKEWRDVVYQTRRDMQKRAERSRRDWDIKLRDREARCKAHWERLQHDLCDIGERFRDEHWLKVHRAGVLERIRDHVLPRVQAFNKWSRRIAMPECLRDRELESRIEARRQFWTMLLPAHATYRDKSGHPWPPAKPCATALRQLRPRPPAEVINKLLVAWCLKDFPS